VGGPGLYDVIIFLDSPKIVHGFELAVTPNPALEVDKHLPHVVISPLIPKMPANAGADATFKFRVADKKTDAPVTGVSDLVIVIMRLTSFTTGSLNWRINPPPRSAILETWS
jgi:hypothetical protein